MAATSMTGNGAGPVKALPRPWQRRASLALLSGVVLAGGWFAWQRISTKPVGAQASGPAFSWIKPGAESAGVATDQALPALRTGLEALPHSLVGTEVDGSAQADAAGHLKLDRGLRNLFDYFLSLLGEEPLARVRERIVAYLRAHLPASAAAEGVNLLDRYLAYEAARGQQGQGDARDGSPDVSLSTLSQRMAQAKVLRQGYFSVAERQAFFGDEEAFDQYTLNKLAVMQDSSLGAVDKAQRLQQLTQALPAELRTSLTAVDSYEDLSALTADWKARGGTPEALHEARVQLVGPEATGRLEALDQQRAQWAQRVQSYQGQKARLMTDASLSPLQREQGVRQLQASLFNEQERLRLSAIDGAPVHP